MPIYDIFSKRMRREHGEMPDVYQYTKFDQNLRVRIVQIIEKDFNLLDWSQHGAKTYKQIIDILCHEYGWFDLGTMQNPYDTDYNGQLMNYFLKEPNAEKALDVVELCFKAIENLRNEGVKNQQKWVNFIDNSIQELNDRFKESGFGYQYESGCIIKMTSEYTHNEIVKPALHLLSDKQFAGAQEEFLSAHKHFRNGRNEECINDCLKSFESTMKIICKIKKIAFNENDTAKPLLTALYTNNYIPKYLQEHYTNLRMVLESGVPTIRNKTGAHGQGEEIRVVDDGLAELALNLTASNIVFLVSLLDKGAK
ncbi:MAG: hypothetical protein LBM77_08585 [Spirochaetaceae bacterium]|jgi:hypothetical protein|nr:hypothetical protein [Spirochaetaceae bacterium]